MQHAARTTHHAARTTHHAALILILLLAFILRVYRLDAQSLWYDEAVTAQVAAKGMAELTRWTADDIQPPLYYYVVAGWTRLAGRSEWALRFPSAFFGSLTVALLWALGRRFFGRGWSGQIASLTVAGLAAISPLYVYYAQEARMYTLLTFLGVLAGYALLRATGDGRRTTNDERRATDDRGSAAPVVGRWSLVVWWFAFILASVAMLYTHYFGAFLLAAYGVIVVGVWGAAAWQRRTLRRPAALLAFLAIALLYLPWLPAMLTRYRVDASYWQGALKLDEALQHIAISFTTGAPEVMLEAEAVRLLPWFGLAFGVAVAALLWGGIGQRMRTDKRIETLVYLSTCLLLPALAILALASRTPKFNPRYLMLVSPAYLLILAGGIGYWIPGIRYGALGLRAAKRKTRTANGKSQHAIRTTHHAPRNIQSLLSGILGAVLLLVPLAASVAALRNWFTDPAFTKAQWRELTAYVRQEKEADEAVLLVSGHAYPAWDYYAADIPAARLPEIDILDVNATLGFEIGPALAEALAGRRGAWLVTWQDEVVDPAGFVPYFLARGGRELPVQRRFWGLGLRHWELTPGAVYPAEPQPQHSQGANFDHKLALLGWDDPQAGQITVYWRTLNTLTADYQVSLVLEDAAGREIGRWDGRPAGYDYPTTRWRPGRALFGRYPLPLPGSAPAGDYFVTLAIYIATDPSGLDLRDVADNPAGKRARLGPIKVGG